MPRPVDNPPNPWLSTHVEYFGEPPPAGLEVFEEEARSVVATNDSPDIPFRYSVNPYRGCYHGCAYCYARPTHQYLGWGAGTDFERKIVVKVNAPALLRQFLAHPKWNRELLAFSGVTDCYQPLEAYYELTRRCLEACIEFANPVGIITKGPLVARDVDVLAELNRRASVSVTISIPFVDEAMARRIEPSVARPSKRFQALATLSAAGIRTGVAIAPIIPGLNDSQIPQILARARESGAQNAFLTLLRLPAEVLPVFDGRLKEAEPLRHAHVLSAIRDVRRGALNNAQFGRRMDGEGPRWQAIEQLFAVHARRLGFNTDPPRLPAQATMRAEPAPKARPQQRSLFGDD
ncbi:PA0069 family radical SAM protein [Nannocystis punicea]|uniref:PA0069 family radical SAM protein n=1 Tax=Nannocystis punicea TaxID=2995304 RepID=A0ABY7H474_9BACT|nr:PA0069 family radical SAM protein [Nannocystis poenicansa]WAS93895.1 PA0069 family radical SAM protein [Nannocystis poenicansa]